MIDEKGKLFGMINLIDLFVLVFVLLLIPMGYYGYKIYNNTQSINNTQSKRQGQWISIKVRVFVVPEITDIIKVGDVEKDPYGKPRARIRAILDKKRMTVTPVPQINIDLIDVVVDVWGICEGKPRVCNYFGSLLRMGSSFHYNHYKYVMNGTIISSDYGHTPK